MCASSVKANEVVRAERPDLAETLHTNFLLSRNGEQRDDEPAWFLAPLVGVEDGKIFCVWSRNRLENTSKIAGVLPLTSAQCEAVEYLVRLCAAPI